MASRRHRASVPEKFVCIVIGKPHSVQTDQGEKLEKSRHYAKWRGKVLGQVAEAADSQSRGSGFDPINGPVKVRLVWYAQDVPGYSDPDVDNIAKPYIDALKDDRGAIIKDDGLVRDLRVIKVDMNDPRFDGLLPEILEARAQGDDFVVMLVGAVTGEELAEVAKEFGR